MLENLLMRHARNSSNNICNPSAQPRILQTHKYAFPFRSSFRHSKHPTKLSHNFQNGQRPAAHPWLPRGKRRGDTISPNEGRDDSEKNGRYVPLSAPRYRFPENLRRASDNNGRRANFLLVGCVRRCKRRKCQEDEEANVHQALVWMWVWGRREDRVDSKGRRNSQRRSCAVTGVDRPNSFAWHSGDLLISFQSRRFSTRSLVAV